MQRLGSGASYVILFSGSSRKRTKYSPSMVVCAVIFTKYSPSSPLYQVWVPSLCTVHYAPQYNAWCCCIGEANQRAARSRSWAPENARPYLEKIPVVQPRLASGGTVGSSFGGADSEHRFVGATSLTRVLYQVRGIQRNVYLVGESTDRRNRRHSWEFGRKQRRI